MTTYRVEHSCSSCHLLLLVPLLETMLVVLMLCLLVLRGGSCELCHKSGNRMLPAHVRWN